MNAEYLNALVMCIQTYPCASISCLFFQFGAISSSPPGLRFATKYEQRPCLFRQFSGLCSRLQRTLGVRYFPVLTPYSPGYLHQETSRPPFVDSRDIKRMLACPDEEMHKFSDPKNYRTRPRYTRLALPLREIEGAIQVKYPGIRWPSRPRYVGGCGLSVYQKVNNKRCDFVKNLLSWVSCSTA